MRQFNLTIIKVFTLATEWIVYNNWLSRSKLKPMWKHQQIKRFDAKLDLYFVWQLFCFEWNWINNFHEFHLIITKYFWGLIEVVINECNYFSKYWNIFLLDLFTSSSLNPLLLVFNVFKQIGLLNYVKLW